MKKTRAGKNTTDKPEGSRKIEKIYYIVIGLLIVILGGLVIFIVSNRDDALTEGDQDSSSETEIITDTEDEDETDLEDEAETEESDQDEDTDPEVTEEDEEADTEEEDTESDVDTEEEAETEEEPEEEPEETEETPDEDDSDEEEASEAGINPDAPLDESYTMNFNDGTSDRNAVDQNASAVTGINQNDMTTWWVGNNGLGRAFTVVSDSGRNNVYRVDLQYGEGEWHVTGVQELDGVPAEYR
ncbi:DUF1510 family protein [Alkalibacterium sp. 20]|uniref:DUF1510 family protein n=1 Tax=Alkalibacterium sp. 20 TaxID=1798803 RepID=UPI0009003749|nr:DUF1510 family protein [Alkalibacterium sp. 20]OJF94044.1 hypothetical protein AX762_08225 [Alkalibacterium sp. 20]